MENEDLIRRKMERTRESITDKLETLEKKLSESVEEVNSAVTSAKETVHESVESVKDFMDVKAHVQRHPWVMVGGAVACGYVLGSLVAKDEREPPRVAAPLAPIRSQPTQGNGRHKTEKTPAQESSSWWSAFAPEIESFKSMALGAAVSALRDVVAAEVPPKMADQVRTLFDDVARKFGGEPLPPEPQSSTRTASCTGAEAPAMDLEKPRW